MPESLSIVEPGRIDAAWMSAALRAGGVEAAIAGVTLSPVGTGQIADTFRLAIDYRGARPPGAPATLVGKFPSTDAGSRAAARHFDIYRAEALFYRHLAASARMRVPHPWLVLFDDSSHDFVVLLEDLGGLRCGDQMRGCTLDEARAVTVEAARLHASHWNDPALLAADWIKRPAEAWGFYTTAQIEELWPRFEARFRARLDGEVFAVAERLARGFAAWSAPRARPRAITHNDLRPDNILFATAAGQPPLVVVDWQTMTFGTAATDLAYFLGGALPWETRRAHEPALLRRYHEELLAGGVTGYDFDDFMTDYRHMAYVGAVMAIGSSTLVKQTERGDAMFMAMLRGAAHHVIDLGALDILPAR